LRPCMPASSAGPRAGGRTCSARTDPRPRRRSRRRLNESFASQWTTTQVERGLTLSAGARTSKEKGMSTLNWWEPGSPVLYDMTGNSSNAWFQSAQILNEAGKKVKYDSKAPQTSDGQELMLSINAVYAMLLGYADRVCTQRSVGEGWQQACAERAPEE